MQERLYEVKFGSLRAFGKLPFGYGFAFKLPAAGGTLGSRAAVLFLNDNLDTLNLYYQNRNAEISFPPLAIDSFSSMVVTAESNFTVPGTMFTQVHKFGYVMGNVLQPGSQTNYLVTCGIKRPDKGFLVCGAKTTGLNPTRVAGFRIWTDSLGVQQRQDTVLDFGGITRVDRIFHRPGGGYYLIGTWSNTGWVKGIDAVGRTIDSAVLFQKVNPVRDITAKFFAEPAPGGGSCIRLPTSRDPIIGLSTASPKMVVKSGLIAGITSSCHHALVRIQQLLFIIPMVKIAHLNTAL